MPKRKRKTISGNEPPFRHDPKFAMELVDDMDLPDGAYWAMLEELTGMEPGDFIDYGDEVFPCSLCPKICETQHGLNMHIKAKHPKGKRQGAKR